MYIYKSSEAQRAANRRYREKIKDTAEYKEKVKLRHKTMLQLIDTSKSIIHTKKNTKEMIFIQIRD